MKPAVFLTIALSVPIIEGAWSQTDTILAKNESNNQTQFWPAGQSVDVVDPENTFTSNLSGLHFQPASDDKSAVLWSVQNNPSRVDRLVWNGLRWAPEVGDWEAGKMLAYPDGGGSPDAEGITKAEWDDSAIYVSTERNNRIRGNRLSVLRYDETVATKTLIATHEWNLTSLLPEVSRNQGIEGITWISDYDLVSLGFVDESKGKIYNANDYSDHGTGLFILGLEGTGEIFIVALNHRDSSAAIIVKFQGGHEKGRVMSLEFDREEKRLWVGCDNSCDNNINVFRLDNNSRSPTSGQFVLKTRYQPPENLPNSNNEGIAFQSGSYCVAGEKSFFWADDNNLDSHALRRGSIPCEASSGQTNEFHASDNLDAR